MTTTDKLLPAEIWATDTNFHDAALPLYHTQPTGTCVKYIRADLVTRAPVNAPVGEAGDDLAQKIIDYMGEYLEGNPLLIQENAVRYAVKTLRTNGHLQGWQSNELLLRTRLQEMVALFKRRADTPTSQMVIADAEAALVKTAPPPSGGEEK